MAQLVKKQPRRYSSSAVESLEKEQIGKLIDSWEEYSSDCGWLLIIGLLVEIIFGFSETPVQLVFIAQALVAFGVFGEWDAHRQERALSKRISFLQEQEIAQVYRLAAEANERAEAARAGLAKHIAWRNFDIIKFSDSVKKFAPQDLDVIVYSQDLETHFLASGIHKALKDLGWSVNRRQAITGATSGLWISTPTDAVQSVINSADGLNRALSEQFPEQCHWIARLWPPDIETLDFRLLEGTRTNAASIRIIVGPNPDLPVFPQ